MESRKTKYYRIVAGGGESNFIRAEAYYDLGGYSYFTYKRKPRGYYVSLSPVSRDGCMESYRCFSGVGGCIIECSRQNRKDYEQAKKYLDDNALSLIESNFPGMEVAEEPEFCEER